jgi:hypothetical protein
LPKSRLRRIREEITNRVMPQPRGTACHLTGCGREVAQCRAKVPQGAKNARLARAASFPSGKRLTASCGLQPIIPIIGEQSTETSLKPSFGSLSLNRFDGPRPIDRVLDKLSSGIRHNVTSFILVSLKSLVGVLHIVFPIMVLLRINYMAKKDLPESAMA